MPLTEILPEKKKKKKGNPARYKLTTNKLERKKGINRITGITKDTALVWLDFQTLVSLPFWLIRDGNNEF